MEKNKLSICLFVNSNSFYLENILNVLSKQDIYCFEIISVLDESNKKIEDIIDNSNLNIKKCFKEDNIDLFDYIQSKYVFILDSNTDLFSFILKDSIDYIERENLDVLLFNSEFQYETNDENISCKLELQDNYVKNIFKLPKFNIGIYKVDYLKKLNVNIPFENDYSEKIYFHFKTLLSTSKTEIVSERIIDKRILNECKIDELILNNSLFNRLPKKHNRYKLDNKRFFRNISEIFKFFEEKDLFDKYKYNILNYIFNLLRNIYELKIINDIEFFTYLKEFIYKLNSTNHTNLLLNLNPDNIKFYNNVLKSNHISELYLRYDYESLLIENEKLSYKIYEEKYLMEKFKTARFDIKNRGTAENNVVLKYISDNKAIIDNPNWFNNDSGTGTVIKSFKKSINLNVECIQDGTFELVLRGIDFRDSRNKNVPIFIDFTKLIINEKIIINENKLVSHDNPFTFSKKVKNGDEIKIHAEWLPISKRSSFEFHNIPKSLLPFTTIRLDVKNYGDSQNKVQIISNDDKNSIEYNPKWFSNDKGIGTIIESHKSKIDFRVKCFKTGQLKLFIRSIDLKDKNGKRIPLQIDITNLKINDKKIIDDNILISHDKPFEYNKNVSDGEIIHFHVEWAPISNNSNLMR